MKKTLLFIALVASASLFAQTQPTVINPNFDKIDKNSGSACACSGWINKSLADQAESSTKDSNDVVKFDNHESDGIYQEIAVEANSDYTLDLDYWYSDGTTTSTQYIEVIILKGSAYVDGYTPAYATAADAEQDGFGYASLTEADNVNNHVARTTVAPPGNSDKNSMTQLAFNTGSETSIAIFIRAVGPYDATSHGDSGKDKGWMNGDTEVRVDNLSLVNLGATASVNDIFSSKISIYPNPANDFISVSTSETITGMEIYNLIGKKVVSSANTKNNTINVSNLAKGVYVLKVMSNDLVASRKIIIE
ncbi:T9SS type A sorting domain-containing protein [Polaribacter sp. Z022]|uniref:T9SS type A sorting domain-containing protein n=1 Tax=Polaribacter sp. Z022 TaxID=2927125 RepID=UPI0020226B5B|nr:T9SS type A sorting domain-containing protein [Polaribacter sp. Z022]MCL7753860.1 T9SS type A sorting domain-containing protein [Polaribacter sp. Z022]